MALLTAENVSFSYDKKHKAVNGADISVERGEYVAVIGHNGSGKSTLARLFNALLIPDFGKITVDGFCSDDKKSLFEIRKRVGVVFQNPDNQLVASIAEDDVAFGPENLGVPRKEIGERIDYALKAVGMEEYRRSAPSRLSGGQKQRIAIAGVLALKPQVLVLDESTAMLDPQGRKEILEVVKRLNKEENVTVITITHYMEEVLEADKVYVMDGGRIAFSGTPEYVFSDIGRIKTLGLELPLAGYIAEKLRERGVPVSENVMTPEGLLEALCVSLPKI